MEATAETSGVAVVRVWRDDNRTLIRIIAKNNADDAEPDDSGFVTGSIDEALRYLRTFIDP